MRNAFGFAGLVLISVAALLRVLGAFGEDAAGAIFGIGLIALIVHTGIVTRELRDARTHSGQRNRVLTFLKSDMSLGLVVAGVFLVWVLAVLLR